MRVVGRLQDPLYDAPGDGGGGGGDEKDLISRAEAQKAFKDRDAAKQKARDLEKQIEDLKAKVMTEEQRELLEQLQADKAKAEEERAKKAGEFETLKKQQQERFDAREKEHQKQLADRDAQAGRLTDRFRHAVVKAEFGAASDYFGGSETSKTILDVDLGMSYLGRYVSVEDVEDDPLGYRVVVKNPKGEVIFGADGNPAPFAEAIGELIKQLPNKDRILRGSGKTGSGSSGGSLGTTPVDLRNLTPARLRDPEVQKALRAARTEGGVVMGASFQK